MSTNVVTANKHVGFYCTLLNNMHNIYLGVTLSQKKKSMSLYLNQTYYYLKYMKSAH